MGKRAEEAVKKHACGYNCAQAVACTFSDIMNMDEKDVFKLSEGFGFGMGINDVCGAVTGMMMVASTASSDGNMDKPATKQKTYKEMRELQSKFAQMNTSIYCRDLLGGKGKPKLRSCPGCVEDAATLLEEAFDIKE